MLNSKLFDHTLLKADATTAQIDKICDEALANIVSIINPHLILLSGAIFTNLHNAEVVQESLMKHAFLADYKSLRVVPLDMGEYAGAIGAAACCIEKYFVRA